MPGDKYHERAFISDASYIVSAGEAIGIDDRRMHLLSMTAFL